MMTPALLTLAVAIVVAAAAYATGIPTTVRLNHHTSLFHIPVTVEPVHVSSMYSFSHRPWYNASILPSFSTSTQSTTESISSSPIHGSITPLGEYFAVLSFNGQSIRVQLDTGSSTMAVPLAKCTNCLESDKRLRLSTPDSAIVSCTSSICDTGKCIPSKTNPLTKALSSSCGSCSAKRQCCSQELATGCSFQLRYADESGVSGTLVNAHVRVGALETDVVVGGIMTQSSFETKKVDGIFGLSFKTLACNPTCVLPLVDKLYEDGSIDANVFSMCLNSKGGVLTLGGSNPDLYEGELTYVPFSSSFHSLFYKVDINSWSIAGNPVNLPVISNGIVDSGTTLLVVSEKTYYALQQYFFSVYCNVPGLCPPSVRTPSPPGRILKHPYYFKLYPKQVNVSAVEDSIYSIKQGQTWFAPGYCVSLKYNDILRLPSMTIHLNGYDLQISPDDYMIKHYVGNTLYYCLGIAPLKGMESLPNDVILGDTVLQKYFVEYDRSLNRVGFAVAKNCNDPTAVESSSAYKNNGAGIPPPVPLTQSTQSPKTDDDGDTEESWWQPIFSNLPSVVFYVVVLILGLFGASKFINRSGYQPIQS